MNVKCTEYGKTKGKTPRRQTQGRIKPQEVMQQNLEVTPTVTSLETLVQTFMRNKGVTARCRAKGLGVSERKGEPREPSVNCTRT